MRLFVAVDLPEPVRQAAARAGERIREELARARSRSRITWVSPNLLHLTLVFLGEVAEAHGAVAVERFRAPLPLGPFRIGIGGPGLFPASGRPRVLWLAVSEGAAALAAVRTAVEARLEGIPYARDHRVFSPHLTIGRFRDGGTLDDRGTVARSLVADSGTAAVDLVTLYQSRLSPRGPEHTALATSSLVSVEGT